MVSSHLFVAVFVAAAPASSATAPSVAVMSLDAQYGVPPNLAALLTDRFAQLLMESQAFSRVVTQREIETALGFEKAQQMVGCSKDSCLTELTGALGVDLLVAGNVGKVGDSFLFNARLIDVHKGMAASSASERVPGGREDALLDAMGPVVAQLILGAGLTLVPGFLESHARVVSPPPAVVAPPAPTPPPAPPAPQQLAAPAPVVANPSPPPEEKPSGIGKGPLMAGLVAGGLAPLALIAGALLALGAYAGGGYLVGSTTGSNLMADVVGGAAAGGIALATAVMVLATLSTAAVLLARAFL